MKKLIVITMIFAVVGLCKSQTLPNPNDSIEDLFLHQLSVYPQEKIYLHTDKSSYVTGETIWFRVHLVDAVLHKQANASRYVYVELINPLSEVVNRVMVTHDSAGYIHGYIKLNEPLPEGNYTFRAYTRFMQNNGEDYFFRKSIYIIDPQSSVISTEVNYLFEEKKINAEIYFKEKASKKPIIPEKCKLYADKANGQDLSFTQESAMYTFDPQKIPLNRVFMLETTYNGRKSKHYFSIPEPDDSFDVAFFPEGGQVPMETDVRIAFKALKKNGLHEEIKGKVYDDTGVEYDNFESFHLGMGMFRMYYLPERTYYAIVTNSQNISKRVELPKPVANAYSLKTTWTNGRLIVSVIKPSHQVISPDSKLVAHLRGAVLYSQPWNTNQEYIRFEKDFFPAGVVHLLFLDKENNILSERLVFSSQQSTFAHTSVVVDKQQYKTRDKISLTIKVTDENNDPVAGNYSIAVTDMNDIAVDTFSNIISSLLLTSELKGYIESPLSYMQFDKKESVAALDVLMMTQGWRRYDIPALLKGRFPDNPTYPLEFSREFTGRVSGIFSSLKDGNISLMAIRDSLLGTSFTKPDKEGKFVFKGIDYPDSTRYIIQALTRRDSKTAFITMDSVDIFPDISLAPLPLLKNLTANNSYITKSNEKYVIENGMRVINLAELEVRGTRKARSKTASPYYSVSSSLVLSTEEIEKANFLTVFDLLRRLPGITISGSEVYYRRATPMLILDNIPVENYDYNLLDVNDISDAFVSPATTVMPIFGARGANGAIVINTKKGVVLKNSLNKNMHVLAPIGYQQHVSFYSPAYETEEQRSNTKPDLRSTIYWNPGVKTDSTGTAHLSFFSADAPSDYQIVIEGVSNFGHIINSSKEIVEIR